MPRLIPGKFYVVFWGQEGNHTRGDAVLEGPHNSQEEARRYLRKRMVGEDEDWVIDGDEAICDAGVLVEDEEGVVAFAIVEMCNTLVPGLNAYKKIFNDKKAAMQAEHDEKAERAELERLKGKYPDES